MKPGLFLVIIYCSAFLLFQIQPVLTKELLPQFGGGASVWSASMVLYQALLLCGYLYAHYLSKLSLRLQFTIHGTFLILAVMMTFEQFSLISPNFSSPILSVMWKLVQQVGIAFILLSSTSVLLQHWHTRTSMTEIPYQWYSLSNIGSLVALISYPFFFEVNFDLSTQKHYWLVVFTVLVLLNLSLMIWISLQSSVETSKKPTVVATRQPLKRIILWLILSATGSIMLVSTTQMISTNIPPMPLIWVLPLATYLISYVFSFYSETSYQRTYWFPLVLFAIFAGLMMYFLGSQFSGLVQLVLYCVILLISCVVCHGELRQLAPGKDALTQFYLTIAVGSVIGSLFATLLAPVLFERLTEYALGLFFVLILYAVTGMNSSKIRKQQVGWAAMILFYCASFIGLEQGFTKYDIATARNFYGFIAVKDIEVGELSERRLVDGTTVHGTEPLNNESKLKGSYYQQDTGVAVSLNYLQQKPTLDIGIIGLGAGVLAEYSRESDNFYFYELNPAVHTMASQYFSYLDTAEGHIDVQISDGRLALQNRVLNANSSLDALIIDAFSSDVIPSHLLTHEAMDTYWKNLKEEGLLTIHISNNHIDLMPVLKAHARRYNKKIVKFNNQGKSQHSYSSDWVILTSDTDFVERQEDKLVSINEEDVLVEWRDERYSLLPLLKHITFDFSY